MTSDKKWREFWLDTEADNYVWFEPCEDTIHVIEKAALDEANAKIERLEKEISKLHEDVSSSGTIGVMVGYEQAKDKIKSQKQIIEKLKGALQIYADRPTISHMVVAGPDEYFHLSEFTLKEIEEMEKENAQR